MNEDFEVVGERKVNSMVQTNRLSFVIIDDHELFCVGLAEILKSTPEFSFLGYFHSVDTFLEQTLSPPKVLLLDIGLDSSNGLDAIPQIRKKFPEILIAVITMHKSEFYLFYALRLGIDGYLLKDMSPHEFVRGLLLVGRGVQYFSPAISNMAVNVSFNKRSVIANLTKQEMKIVELIGEGLTSKAIASRLNVSSRTVEGHRTKILAKLGLKNSFGIVRFLFESKSGKI